MTIPDNDIDLDERTYERELDPPDTTDDDEARADDPCADDGLGDY